MSNMYFKSSDNSGVEKVLLITNLTRKGQRARVGDLVVGVVKKTGFLSSNTMSTIVYGVVIRTKEILLERK